jgi:hypothetical protein
LWRLRHNTAEYRLASRASRMSRQIFPAAQTERPQFLWGKN